MTTLDEAIAAEREALQDAAAAETTAMGLAQRLESGDATVTADQLEDAHRFARWARSHAKGVSARRQKAAAEAAVSAARDAIDRAVNATDDLDAELVERWREAVAAISSLVAVAKRRSATVWEHHNSLDVHRELLSRVAGVDLAELGALPGRETGTGLAGYRIPGRSVDVADVRPADVIAEAIYFGNANRIPLGEATVAGRAPLAGSSLAAKITGWDAAARGVTAS